MKAHAAGWLLAVVGALAQAACSGERTRTVAGEGAGDITTVRSALTTIAVAVTNTSGAPQAGVLVYAQSESTWQFVQSQTTNAQGVATFSLANDSYLFARPGEPSSYYFYSGSCQTPSCTSASITVTTPVLVTVVDTDGVPQADVQVLAEDSEGSFVNYNFTDASGQAPVSVLPGTYQIAVPGSGPGFLFHGPECTVPGCTATTVTITHPVTVTVVDAQGTPLPGVQVMAEDPNGQYWNLDYTDAQGQVQLSVDPGAYRFVVPEGPVLIPSGAHGSCAVPGCTTATIVIPDPVVVTVVDGAGQPIADQPVLARVQGSSESVIQTTNASGQASFKLPAGGWHFEVACDAETFVSGAPGSCQTPGCTAAGITMICGACAGQPNGTSCNDANACTQTDTCQGGACVGGNPITCSPSDQCHVAGTCNLGTGLCSNPPAANGTSCSDGNACTQTDACQSGTCAGANPVTCNPQDQCHDAGTCDTSTGVCSNPSKPNGTSCSDGNACTQTDTCQNGSCLGSNPVVCSAQGECTTAGECIPASGVCTNPPVAQGTICTGGLCASGVCAPSGNPPTPVDRTVPMDLQQSTAFLYEGPNPQQIGVPAGTIKRDRAGVCRGKVLNSAGQGIKGVVVRVVGRPEYGFTQTGDDGIFSMAVNGGEQLRLHYERTGYLSLDRIVKSRPLDYAPLPDVVLTAMDPARTIVDLSNTTAIQVAQATPTSDDSGPRQSIVLFFPGTTATLVRGDGSTVPLDTLTVHSTEFTVGDQGPRGMPAELPPTSGYTYAIDLSVEEAAGDELSSVTFNQPVVHYVDNFLHFSVGSLAPVGYYDEKCGCWAPSDNGKVIRILSDVAGLAEVDADGDGDGDSPTELAALGITDEERTTLASLYFPGDSLWRVPLTHFTKVDINWPSTSAAPALFTGPHGGSPSGGSNGSGGGGGDQCQDQGSIINCHRQILGERVPLTGVPYALRYDSSRVPGFRSNVLDIKLSDQDILPEVLRIDLEVSVAGQRVEQSFPPGPDQDFSFVWNGLDAFGRPLSGRQATNMSLKYVYASRYIGPPEQFKAFAQSPPPGFVLDGDTGRGTLSLAQEMLGFVENTDARRTEGLGGWSLDVHHRYDPRTLQLTLGNGTTRSAPPAGLNRILPTKTVFADYWDILPAPDGSIYLVTPSFGSFPFVPGDIVRLRTDGILETVAADVGASVLPSNSVLVPSPSGILFVPYVGFFRQVSIRRLNTDGTVSDVAGGPNCDLNSGNVTGDEGPATQACFGGTILDVAAVPNGDIYVSGQGNENGAGIFYVRRIDCNGIIHRVLTGVPVRHLESRSDSSIFLEVFSLTGLSPVIKKLMPDGTLSSEIAGRGNTPQLCIDGDGSGGVRDTLCNVTGTEMGPDGQLYVSMQVRPFAGQPAIIRGTLHVVRPDGKVAELFPGLGMDVREFRIAANGDFLVAAASPAPNPPSPSQYWGPAGIYWLRSSFPQQAASGYSVPSRDGGEIYVFDTNGRHLRTLDGLTSTTKYVFAYNAGGVVSAIADQNGLTTSIQRDGSGNPTAIVSPTGQQTTLGMDSNGYLASVLSPGGAQYQFQYQDGLLTREVDPRNGVHVFTYDAKGKLIRDENPAGGGWTLDAQTQNGTRTVTMVSGEGRSKSYAAADTLGASSTDAPAFVGSREKVITAMTGLQTLVSEDALGDQQVTSADGTVVTTTLASDPRFGMAASYAANTTVNTPGGLTQVNTMARTATVDSGGITLVSQTDVTSTNGRSSTTTYDGASRATTNVSPAGRQRITTRDTQGRISSLQIGTLAPTTYGYDPRGRLASITRGTGPESRVTSYSYDALDRMITATDPLSLPQTVGYDADNRMTSVVNEDEAEAMSIYDPAGDQISVSPPGRSAHQFVYTPAGDLDSYAPPSLGAGSWSTSYAYDRDRQLKVVTRPDGKTIILAYDGAGRLSATTCNEVAIAHTYSSTTGNLTDMVTTDGEALAMSHDGRLLLTTTWSGSVAGSVSRTWNNDFRVVAETVNDGSTMTFEYDPDGLITGVGAMTLSRDPSTGLITGTTLGGISDVRSYNTFGERLVFGASYGSTPIFATEHVRDKLGRVTTRIETIDGATKNYVYGYDPAGRLQTVTTDGVVTATYEYDQNGNRLSKVAPTGTEVGTYDAQDRLLTYGHFSYTYTANGELLSKSDTAAMATTNYSYDTLGQLRRVESAQQTIEYVIDPLGRRIAKKVNGVIAKRWLYDGPISIVAELDGSGALVSRFFGDVLLRSGSTYRLIRDQLGSVRLVVDASTGAVVQRIDYDEFGNVLADSAPGFQPFGFAGGHYDPDTGLVRFGTRDYDSQTGRWTARDIIGFGGGETLLYGYAGNDPINKVDRLGMLQVPADIVADFPLAAARIASLESRITAAMLAAFAIYGQANASQVSNALARGRGPQIRKKGSGDCGRFTPNTGSNVIEISRVLLRDFENGLRSGKQLDATILHELVHYFDDQDGVDYPGEEGDLFETASYGHVIQCKC